TSSDYINNDPEGTAYYRQHTVYLRGAEGKYIAFLSDFGSSNYFTVDDVTIEEIPSCIPPVSVHVEVLSATSAKVKWESDADSVWVILTDSVGAETHYMAHADSIVFTNLESLHQYKVQLQGMCGGAYSQLGAVYTFTTSASVPYLQEFEANYISDLAGWERGKGLLNGILAGGEFAASTKWMCGTKATAAEANIDGKSAYIEIWSTSTQDWLLSPVLDLTTADSTMNLQLSMTLALSHYSSHTAVAAGAQPDDVFAVVISEDGGNTWTADNVTRWDTAATSAHSFEAIPVEGETYYVDLNKYKGKVIRIGLYGESTVSNTDNYLYVDNFTIDNVDPSCMGVKLQIDSVVANMMYASWQTIGNDTVMVQLADEAGNTVYSATTTDTTLVQSDLAWRTTYTLTVQQICGSRAAQKSFITPYAPVSIPYFEPFGKEAMERWTEAGGVNLEEAFAGNEFTKTYSSWYIGLKTDGTEVNIHDTSAYMNVYSSSQKEWLISPSIIMPELDETASVELSLTAALSTFSGHSAIDPAKQQSHRFAVVISEDDGATWKQSNMTLWDNAGKGTYVYNDIPVEGRTYQIDLAKYQGKVIRVALYAGCTVSDQGDNYLYVDDITIKGLVGVNYAAAQCNSTDYHDEFFTIPYDSLVIGTTEYTTRRNGQENAPDTLYTLSLTVYPAVQTVIYDTICQGYRYTANGFDEEVLQSTMLSMRTTSSNGCDSMVTVYVEVLPTVYSDTTIYACTEYTLNGTTYYSNQVLMDTLVSATGCDSISRIFLRISPEASYETEWRTAICAGSSFSDEVFTDLTEPGTYVDTVSTRFGCDSIVTLHLLVADASMNAYDTIELEDLPYIYEGDTILSGAVQKGNVYKHDVHADCGTVTLNVYIKDEEMGISNVEYGCLTIAPNPVHAGEDIRLMNTFRPADDYVLTVHDALGQAVYTTHTAQSQIPGISVSGYYVVRVVNNGQVFQAKLLVQ
ncbi:MAG: T9SS type A sorting domain-containing protein, partial [Paludibacteraceae bacterium]